jgi:hypothetical protein
MYYDNIKDSEGIIIPVESLLKNENRGQTFKTSFKQVPDTDIPLQFTRLQTHRSPDSITLQEIVDQLTNYPGPVRGGIHNCDPRTVPNYDKFTFNNIFIYDFSCNSHCSDNKATIMYSGDYVDGDINQHNKRNREKLLDVNKIINDRQIIYDKHYIEYSIQYDIKEELKAEFEKVKNTTNKNDPIYIEAKKKYDDAHVEYDRVNLLKDTAKKILYDE